MSFKKEEKNGMVVEKKLFYLEVEMEGNPFPFKKTFQIDNWVRGVLGWRNISPQREQRIKDFFQSRKEKKFDFPVYGAEYKMPQEFYKLA